MLELLKKDLRISLSGYKGKTVLIILISYFIFFNVIGEYYAFEILPAFLSYIFIMQTFSKTSKSNANNYLLSMPVKRGDVVFSKYILSLLSILIVSFTILALNRNNLFGTSNISMEHIYVYIVSFLLSMSIILPLVFKLGYKITKFLAPVISIITFIYINKTTSLNGLYNNGKENLLIKICRSIGGLINNVEKNRPYDYVEKSTEVFFILVPILVLIIFIMSMAVSIYIYNKKDIE
ncbi:ABC-2 transporter permease [Clostridium sp.]|uniref:ABC-2 transporter permease n=1 Tax=Clostridium sp. TaxID=1506 RepID=UPI002624E26B|nr:ABC-2 transporter permease [Clostridium sp.]